jgi:DNA primase
MEIAEIIKQLSILTVLEHYHLKPNRNKVVCCLFHEDINPQLAGVPQNQHLLLL